MTACGDLLEGLLVQSFLIGIEANGTILNKIQATTLAGDFARHTPRFGDTNFSTAAASHTRGYKNSIQYTVPYSIHVRHEGTTHAHIHTSLLVSIDIHRHIQIYTHTPSHTLMTHIFSKTGFTDQSFIHMFIAMHVDPWTFNRQLTCWYWEGQTH